MNCLQHPARAIFAFFSLNSEVAAESALGTAPALGATSSAFSLANLVFGTLTDWQQDQAGEDIKTRSHFGVLWFCSVSCAHIFQLSIPARKSTHLEELQYLLGSLWILI